MAASTSSSNSTSHRLPENWLAVAALITLAGCVIGLVAYWVWMTLGAYLGWWSKTVPGYEPFLRGRKLLVDAKPMDANLVDAIKEFDKAIALNSLYAPAWYYRGRAYERQGKLDLALAGYTDAIDHDKEIAKMGRAKQDQLHAVPLGFESAGAYFDRAVLRNGVGKPDEAIEDFNEVLKLDSGNAAAYRGKGTAYLKKDNPEQALLELNEAVRLSPDSPDSHCLRARANLAAGYYAQAAEDARRAIQLDPKSGDAFLALGSALLSLPVQPRDAAVQALRDALRLYEAAAAPGREQAVAYYNLSVGLDRAGETAAAKKAFDLARHLNPDAAPPTPDAERSAREQKLVRAKSCLAGKLFDDAIGEFTSILLTDPRNVEALLGRGSAFVGKKDWDLAIGDFDQLIELDPHSAKDYCLRAEAYLNKGDYYLARLDATQAIRLEPNNALAYFYRADACCKGRDFEPALANLADAVRLEKKAPQRDRQFERRGGELYEEIYQNQARAYADGRQREKVVDCLLAIDHSPYLGWTDVTPEKRAQRLRQMAQAYQDLGSDRLESKNWDDAIQGFGKAISVDKSLARQLDPQLARAYGERGFDHAKHRELTQAGLDLNTALGIAYKFDKDYAPVYRLCGLTCCLLAEDCRQRGPFADEKGYWKDAIQFLKWAIRLAPDLEYELRRPLDDAQRNSARLSAPAGSTPVGLPVPYRSNDLPPATYAPAPAPVTVLN